MDGFDYIILLNIEEDEEFKNIFIEIMVQILQVYVILFEKF